MSVSALHDKFLNTLAVTLNFKNKKLCKIANIFKILIIVSIQNKKLPDINLHWEIAVEKPMLA